MQKLFSDVLSALLRGEHAVLTAVVESRGSTPRKLGSVMAVFADGSSVGTLGGGAIEYTVIKAAQAALAKVATGAAPQCYTEGYSLSDGGELRMICGGDVTVHSAVIEPNDYTLMTFERALSEPPEGGVWLALRIKSGEPTHVSLEFKQPSFHSTVEPEQLHSRVHFAKENDDFDGLLTIPLTADGTVYVFGGGHVGRALVPVLTHLGFTCVVYDDRAEYAKPEDFPTAAGAIFGAFTEIGQHVSLTPQDYVVVVTRSHGCDFEVLAHALTTPAGYVGAMGSKRKMTIIRQRLADEAGHNADAIARILAPIGLQIGAETPDELAISIAAELIKVRAERTN